MKLPLMKSEIALGHSVAALIAILTCCLCYNIGYIDGVLSLSTQSLKLAESCVKFLGGRLVHYTK